ncbi:MAG: hypothetical protein N3D10_04400 [Candidatus Micrarchaeota archaeon]|nr:hypothetical protein [Candidatus Micrarchaeota archaeon]
MDMKRIEQDMILISNVKKEDVDKIIAKYKIDGIDKEVIYYLFFHYLHYKEAYE